jgi:aspartate kinase
MIVQNISEKDYEDHPGSVTDMTFSCPVNQVARARKAMEEAKAAGTIAYDELVVDPDVAKVSVVGIGMRSHAGVASRMFRSLADKGINIQAITTSEIKVSVLIAEEYLELALRALHTAYGLDGS